MKKIFAAAALLLAMTACGGSQKKALPLEGTTWKLAKMEAIPAKAVDAEADFFTLQFTPPTGAGSGVLQIILWYTRPPTVLVFSAAEYCAYAISAAVGSCLDAMRSPPPFLLHVTTFCHRT